MKRGIGSDSDDREEVELEVVAYTEKAVLVDTGKKQSWLPLRFVDREDGRAMSKGVTTLLIPGWLVDREELA